MIDVFINKICCCCSNKNCNKKMAQVAIVISKDCTTYKCNDYIKNNKKIVPYKEPLIVTAPREYVTKKEK